MPDPGGKLAVSSLSFETAESWRAFTSKQQHGVSPNRMIISLPDKLAALLADTALLFEAHEPGGTLTEQRRRRCPPRSGKSLPEEQ